ncbi:phosphatidylinositol-specific phospholipase C1-like protein [Tautonia sociabilis]|uniref:Calcium-dependent phosphoinositide phospholipase C n=1 Tax=Tautonia sociabilis TaxID=2080755 RepID=A0A432MMG8_9BACT|nr:phosphatidylinositol-specific phospholipase C1-like protein [Tautonia sociabilis]RUL88631.1 hypothetical protein TsocGM_05690 [Tautonia sociabilis]
MIPAPLVLPLTLAILSPADDGPDPALGDTLRINQLQVIGTHNSYHLAPLPAVRALIDAASPGRAEGLDYSHPPLAEQFGRLRIRQIELDVFADPDGGLFARPMARHSLIALGKDPGPDPNAGGVLDAPGPKVLHVPDIDYRTTAPTLADALRQVRDWSEAHPDHVPILILVELKDGPIPGLTPPRPIDDDAIEAVEQVIRSAFDSDHLITPDSVRGDAETLRDAIRSRGWPLLADSRGKILLALDNTDAIRNRYLDGHPSLSGRLMLADAGSADHPAASWFKRNDPIGQFDEIRELVRLGFLVRTRADADTRQARSGDTSRRDRALASGAQYVSTDYPEPDPRFSDYRVALPGGAEARVNPVSGPVAVGDDRPR